jgi:hypothetical protein
MFSVTWNLKSDGLSIISLVTAAGSLACRSARANSHARSHGYFSFLFFGKCYAIVCVYFCLGEPVKLCVCLHACFLVFKAFRINTDVLAAYTLYSFKHLIASRTFHSHTKVYSYPKVMLPRPYIAIHQSNHFHSGMGMGSFELVV